MSTRRSEYGMTTISYVLATGLSLIVITWCTMFIVMSYARAAIRDAATRGSRSGVVAYSVSQDRAYSIQECNATFESNLEAALPLSIRSSVDSNCTFENESIVIETNGSLRSISPLMPTFSINEKTRRSLETLP